MERLDESPVSRLSACACAGDFGRQAETSLDQVILLKSESVSSDNLRKLLYFWQLFSLRSVDGKLRPHTNTQELVLTDGTGHGAAVEPCFC